MTEEQFALFYGKIKYQEKIERRNPVRGICIQDKNRRLMIKFKYGNISKSEENEFHEAIKKIIYRVMHKNNVMMNWEDVYQEIWKKIIKCKHTWKEWKGTMVSTWITIVANSVINTLRQGINRYNSRVCLYDDFASSGSGDNDDSHGGAEKCDIISYNFDDEAMEDDGIKAMIRREQFEEFLDTLDAAEKHVYMAMLSVQDKIFEAYDGRMKMPFAELRQKTGYDEPTFSMILYNIKKKYSEVFGCKFNECCANADMDVESSGGEYLF